MMFFFNNLSIHNFSTGPMPYDVASKIGSEPNERDSKRELDESD